ncbi:MAG: hypothetical protein H8D56_08280 [Planctomycetes bacterium]|nr:hypothetical protein [Planctomycetota bacterium]MBL7146679.1 hypothetical protein [Phycisphaerae bacterium]
MNPLNNEQKELLFNYCIGLTSQKETDDAESLISSNQEAAEIQQKLRAAIEPLGSLEPESCPDELVVNTISRVQNHIESGQQQLRELLATEQTKKVTIKIGAWRNMSQKAAVAALIIFSIGVLVPTLKSLHLRSLRQRCQMQMGSVFQGLRNYISDYDDQTPAVASIAGAPWWKLGDQGGENHSNTRNVYLLSKGDYVDVENFVCPACKGDVPLKLTDSQIKRLKDFPSRRYVTYSFQINCRRTSNGKLLCRKVIMADMNPLFENLPEDFSKQFRLQLTRTLLTLNSINHNRRGQNVLFGDGHIKFLKTRFIGFSEDDIYTLQDTDVYQGCEVPSCETDFFLAP